MNKFDEDASNVEVNKQLELASNFNVDTQENYEFAAKFIKECMDLKKKIESFFEPTIERFKKAKQQAEAGRKETVEKCEKYTKKLDEAIQKLRNECKSFENKRIAEAEEKRKKLEEETKAIEFFGDTNAVIENKIELATLKPEIQKVTNLGIRRTWKWKITDESLIPRQYLIVDNVSINTVVRENKGETKIAGIEVYYD